MHRVLDALDSASRDLMRGLSQRCAERAGSFAYLILDVTDTWFVGDGPSLAAMGKTKEGLFQRKIGIVLLCSPEGYPLRWEVIAGNTAEQPAMLDYPRRGHPPWLRDAPIVCDRAMGRSSYVAELAAVGLQFTHGARSAGVRGVRGIDGARSGITRISACRIGRRWRVVPKKRRSVRWLLA